MEVEDGFVAFLGRMQDENRARLVFSTKTRQMGKSGVRAEAIVRVIGTNLQITGGKHEAFAGEKGGKSFVAGWRVVSYFHAGRAGCARAPVLPDKLPEGLTLWALRAVVRLFFVGLSLFSHNPIIPREADKPERARLLTSNTRPSVDM